MLRSAFLFLFFCFSFPTVYAQDIYDCPQNLGFEEGNFNHWKIYTGKVKFDGTLDSLKPADPNGRITLIKRGYPYRDTWGGFSTDSPNGSDYVLRLGKEGGGQHAQRIVYTLDVPSNVDAYSIIFNYAVVLQDPPHEFYQQPRFMVSVSDETTKSTSCVNFDFTTPGLSAKGGGIPGFATSQVTGETTLYKQWSPVLINLTPYRGHKVSLVFTSIDCTEGGHFGYAYIDIDENCGSPISGNITCSESPDMTLSVFPGFAKYRWYDVKTNVTYGTEDKVYFPKPLPIGTRIALELTPQPYYGGCVETIYTTIKNMDAIRVNPEMSGCFSVDITASTVGAGNRRDLVYTYWKDPGATQRIDDPKHMTSNGKFWIKAQLFPSGCFSIVPVEVKIIPLPPIPLVVPTTVNYPMTVDLTKAFVPQEEMSYTYWKDKTTSVPVPNPVFLRVGGVYYIKGVTNEGCIVVTPITIEIKLPDVVIPNTFTPNDDGINDVLTVLLDNRIRIKSFRIYSRWGQPVFSTTDITEFWNGYKGSKKVPDGTYFWFLEADEDAKKYIRQGSVTVIR